MKILYISSGQGIDYQSDVAFHGMRSLLGADIVDFPRVFHMYENSFADGKIKTSDLYGRGFTFSSLFPNDDDIDREDLTGKLEKKYFDYVIYGSIHRNQTWFHGVTSLYDPKHVAFIDGEDHPYVLLLEKYGPMFKRELHGPRDGMYPIHFGIPKEKILQDKPKKLRPFSEYDPLINRAYVYDNENDYYRQYAESVFASTMKKGGWDCLRHYEIMANWCIPYFRCLEACPSTIMTSLPKKQLMMIKNLLEYDTEATSNAALNLYENFIPEIMTAVREKMTTEAVAKYVLDTMKSLA